MLFVCLCTKGHAWACFINRNVVWVMCMGIERIYNICVILCTCICLICSLTMTHVGRPGLEELAKMLEVNKTLEVIRFVFKYVLCAIDNLAPTIYIILPGWTEIDLNLMTVSSLPILSGQMRSWL